MVAVFGGGGAVAQLASIAATVASKKVRLIDGFIANFLDEIKK
jgi:hypothetical protein